MRSIGMNALRSLTRNMRVRNFARRIGPIRRFMWYRSAFFDTSLVRVFDLIRPYTMLSGGQLHNAVESVRKVDREKVPGAIVECGVRRGGCAALMGWLSPGRRLWMFDSFEGLPQPVPQDGIEANGWAGELAVPEQDARDILGKLGVTAEIRKGWFQDTIPAASREIGQIAVLRLDGDFYESTKVCLEYLYDLVPPGGIVIFDDYDRWQGCRIAVDEFMQRRGISAQHFARISAGGGRQFVKT